MMNCDISLPLGTERLDVLPFRGRRVKRML